MYPCLRLIKFKKLINNKFIFISSNSYHTARISSGDFWESRCYFLLSLLYFSLAPFHIIGSCGTLRDSPRRCTSSLIDQLRKLFSFLTVPHDRHREATNVLLAFGPARI